jgi:hypothetical protein
MSLDRVYTSSTGTQVSLDRSSEEMVVESASGLALRIDLQSGTVELLSPGDVSVVSGGRISLDGAKGIDIRTGGDLQLIAEGENVIRGKMVRIN